MSLFEQSLKHWPSLRFNSSAKIIVKVESESKYIHVAQLGLDTDPKGTVQKACHRFVGVRGQASYPPHVNYNMMHKHALHQIVGFKIL